MIKKINNTPLKDYVSNYYGQITDKIFNILVNFNFNLVHDIMVKLDWTWHITTDNTGQIAVPSITELKNTALKLLKQITFDEDHHFEDIVKNRVIQTGGFKVTFSVIDYYDNQPDNWKDDANFQTELTLEFILENWSE